MIRDGIDGLADATHNVCVIGAGPVGISFALELARLGRRVLLLESGGDGPDEAAQALSDAHIADPARHDAMRIAVARRLGGTSNLWGGRCLPYDSIDFEPREVVGGGLWPIDLDDLRPHYGRATTYACAGAPVFTTDELPGVAGPFSTAHLERWSARRKLQEPHRAALRTNALIDVRLHATVTSLGWEGGRVCSLELADRAGRRSSVPVRTLVLATGGLESTRLLLAEQRKRPALFGGADGPLGRHYMGHVIGEIADVTFADEATDRAFDFHIDAHGSYVRRRFTPAADFLRRQGLLNCAFWPIVPPMADPAHRDGFLSAIALALSFDALGSRLIPEAIRRRHIPADMARGPHVANILRDLPGAARDVARLLRRRYLASVPAPAFYKRNAARRYGLAYHSEQSPCAESRVRLAPDHDALGLPRLAIDLRFSRGDAERIVRLHDHLGQFLEGTGLGRLAFRHAPEARTDAVLAQASHGTHQIGTARMGATSTQGVVDRDLRCFGTGNLHVLSSAVLPTSGQANPTLTVMALGMRLAERLNRPGPVPAVGATALESALTTS